MADAKLNIILEATDKTSGELENINNSFSTLEKTALAAGAAIVAGLGYVGKSALDASAALEQQEVAFTGITGSAEAAQTLLAELSDFAARTPFELTGLRDQAKLLLAYGTDVEGIIPLLQDLGDVASIVGTDKMEQLVRALGQIQSKTVLAGQELMQLQETGIPILPALAEVTGIAVADIVGNTKDLGISYDQVREAISLMSEEGGFAYNAMAAQSETFNGKLSNLTDAWTQFLEKNGEELRNWAKEFVDILIDFINNTLPAWIENIESFFNQIKTFLSGDNSSWSENYQALTNTLQTFETFVNTSIRPLIESFFKVLSTILGTFKDFWGRNFGDISDILQKAADFFVINIQPIIEDFFKILTFFLETFVKFWEENWTGIQSILDGTWDIMTGIIETAWGLIQSIIGTGLALLTGDWEGAWNNILNSANIVWDGIKNIIKGAFEVIFGLFGTNLEEIKLSWDLVWDGIKNTASNTIDSIVGWIRGMIDWVSDAIAKIKDLLTWGDKASATSTASGTRQSGGSVTANRSFLVGETGAELFTPNTSGFITPANKLGGSNVTINIQGNFVGNEEEAERLGDMLLNMLQRSTAVIG